MSRTEDLQELRGEIQQYREVSARLLVALRHLQERDLQRIGKTTTTAVAAAGLIENSYTVVETVLFRIAQNFGNNLGASCWHTDLLRRMTVSVPELTEFERFLTDVIASLSDQTPA